MTATDPKAGQQGREIVAKLQADLRRRKFDETEAVKEAVRKLTNTRETAAFTASQKEGTGGAESTAPDFPQPEQITLADAGSSLQGNIGRATQEVDKIVGENTVTTPNEQGASSLPPTHVTDTTTRQTQGRFPGIAGVLSDLGLNGRPPIKEASTSHERLNPQRAEAVQRRITATGMAGFRVANGDMSLKDYTSFLATQRQDASPSELKRMAVEGQAISANLIAEQEALNRQAGKNAFETYQKYGIVESGELARATQAFFSARTDDEIAAAGDSLGKLVRGGTELTASRAAAARGAVLDQQDFTLKNQQIAINEITQKKGRIELEQTVRGDVIDSIEHRVKLGKLRAEGVQRAVGLTGTLTEKDLVEMRETLIDKSGNIRDVAKSLPQLEVMQRNEYRLGQPITSARDEGVIMDDTVLRNFTGDDVGKNIRILFGREQGDIQGAVLDLTSAGYDFFDPGGGVPIKGQEHLGPIMPGPDANKNQFAFEAGLHNDNAILTQILKTEMHVGTLEDEDEISIDNWRNHEGDSPGQFVRDQRNPPAPAAGRPQVAEPGSAGTKAGRGFAQFLAGREEARKQHLTEFKEKGAKQREAVKALPGNIRDFFSTLSEEKRQRNQ